MTTNDEIKPRPDISISLLPDMLLPHREALDVEGTVGRSVYTTGRECLAGLHRALGAMVDTAKAVKRTVDADNPHTPRVMAKARDGKPAAVQLLSGRENELRDAIDAACQRAAPEADARFAQIRKARDAIAERVARALVHEDEKTAKGTAMAQEIRAHAKSLDHNKRFGFVDEALKRGDLRTVSALLGAPDYLSGLNEKAAASLRERAAERFAAADHRQLLAADKLIDTVRTGMGAFMGAFDRLRPPEQPKTRSEADTALAALKSGRAAS